MTNIIIQIFLQPFFFREPYKHQQIVKPLYHKLYILNSSQINSLGGGFHPIKKPNKKYLFNKNN